MQSDDQTVNQKSRPEKELETTEFCLQNRCVSCKTEGMHSINDNANRV